VEYAQLHAMGKGKTEKGLAYASPLAAKYIQD
jgi:hypothetical protein